MQGRRAASLTAVVSARPDGATTVAVGLAAVRSAGGRTLLVDLNTDRADIAPLLDLGEARTIYHLAFNAQLNPVSGSDLEDHLLWHEGVAVLAGVSRGAHRRLIVDDFVSGLLDQALERFDHVVLDLGRVRADIPASATQGQVLWVVVPGPLGVAAVETATVDLVEEEAGWLANARFVLNRCRGDSFLGVDRFLEREYGLTVAGQLPDVPSYLRTVEHSHSVRALSAPAGDDRLYSKRYGAEAVAMRRAFEALVDATAVVPTAAEVASGS
jgi:Mrp family chromosome partitioning ATPase